MLARLVIGNIALIERLDVAFDDGFSVLTGETGAGKSIIIEALNFVLGERASRELVKSGETKASVEALFTLSENDAVYAALREQGLDAEDDTLTLYREFSVAGKNVCRVNGVMVSAAALKAIGDALVDIHGQHAHQSLLNPKKHIDLLDDFIGAEAASVKRETAEMYHDAAEKRRKLNAAQVDEHERERRCDLIAYQMKEIESAGLSEGEEDDLIEQRDLMRNAQAIMQGLDDARETLGGSEAESAVSLCSAALHALDAIAPYKQAYADAAERLRELYYNMEDVYNAVRDCREDFSYEPASLDEIESRLELIASLKRKYGADIPAILAYQDEIAAEYELLSTVEERREALQRAYDEALSRYNVCAERLSELRKTAAAALTERLLPELSDLGMPHASFEVAFARLSGELPSANGADELEFLLSANLGEPVKPLSRVASGGELSRIMLALKTVLADMDRMPTMVFDEIDSGISGQVGTAVAVKMRRIARMHQVLCITHLPQIAAFANHQYVVYKFEEDGRTKSTAVLLEEDARAAEIARVMGADPNDAVALEHAQRLIRNAAELSRRLS